jgi:hypothetical protein
MGPWRNPGAAKTARWDYMLGMSVRGLASLIATTALLSAVAGVSHAAVAQADPKTDAKKAAIDFTVQTTTPIATTTPGPKTLKWDARKGRWGLMVNMEQPDSRASTWNDVQAGAYYRITPSLRVGGAVAMGDQQLQTGPHKLTPDEGQPRVRLETAFKF